MKQRFQFGGMAALFNQEIDILVTPDPVLREGIQFHPVFAYELVLVVAQSSALARLEQARPEQLCDQVLYTYPVETERLDIFRQFLLPAHCQPKKHKVMEATEMMLQMVAADRGVTALPQWLVAEYAEKLPISAVRLGASGLHKQIHLGVRTPDSDNRHVAAFIELARASGLDGGRMAPASERQR